jgi:hypothetical protein
MRSRKGAPGVAPPGRAISGKAGSGEHDVLNLPHDLRQVLRVVPPSQYTLQVLDFSELASATRPGHQITVLEEISTGAVLVFLHQEAVLRPERIRTYLAEVQRETST